MPILLKDLLNETAIRRINLTSVSALVEKLLPELTDTQSKKITELCTELYSMAGNLNLMPAKLNNREEWMLLLTATQIKINELREEIISISEAKKDIDFRPLLKVLDEALTYN